MKCAIFPSDLASNLALLTAAHILILLGTVLDDCIYLLLHRRESIWISFFACS
jgi:hypothetical protein